MTAALAVVCTGGSGPRGHKPWPFGESVAVRVGEDGGPYREVEVLTVRGQEADGSPVMFRCPRCGRNPRFSEDEWHRVCAAWRADGRDTIDIATLPR
jgi:hypothetical protein